MRAQKVLMMTSHPRLVYHIRNYINKQMLILQTFHMCNMTFFLYPEIKMMMRFISHIYRVLVIRALGLEMYKGV